MKVSGLGRDGGMDLGVHEGRGRRWEVVLGQRWAEARKREVMEKERESSDRGFADEMVHDSVVLCARASNCASRWGGPFGEGSASCSRRSRLVEPRRLGRSHVFVRS